MATETLRPNGNGTYTALDGTYVDWDEETANDDTDYVYLPNGVSETRSDSSNLQDTSIPAGSTISEVRVYCRVRCVTVGTINQYHCPFLYLSGSLSWGTQNAMPLAWTSYNEAISRPGGGSWQVSDLNSLEVGLRIIPGSFKSTYYGGRCTQIYVVVTYVAPQTIAPSGIASAQAFGSAKFGLKLLPTSLSSLEAFGSHTIQNVGNEILPSGIASTEAFGTSKITQYLAPSGIASAEAIGTASLTLHLAPPGIATAEAIGSHTVTLLLQFLAPEGIDSQEAFGDPIEVRLTQEISPPSIAPQEAFGTATVTLFISSSGIGSGESFGSSVITLSIVPSGIATAEVFGSTIISHIIRRWLTHRRFLTPYRKMETFSTPYREITVRVISYRLIEVNVEMDKYFRGDTPNIRAFIYDETGALVDPTTSITCSILDPNNVVKQDFTSMTKVSTGKYRYTGYTIGSTADTGKWSALVRSTDGTVVETSEQLFEVVALP